MKIIIISDIHDNLLNLDKVLHYAKDNNIDKMICCGDFGSEATIRYLANNFKGNVRAVFGNADDDHMDYDKVKDKFSNIKLSKDVSNFAIDNKRVLVVHEPVHYEAYLGNEDLQYIFYGHTHKPWQEVNKGKIILNPGNVSNYGYSPTFAVWETENDKFALVQINLLK